MIPLGGWPEIILICFLAFILLKPEDYKTVLKNLGKLLSKIRFYQYKAEAYFEAISREDDKE